ncbi:WD40 repeat domain-containing protein [Actinoallomurus rhizosphaericola]|uniref:WD40 repeat domain-containing protein n=1 Tax=Actinoallomurus rhizosphaericola TaxID=2952536 RepID=UPI0020932F50|nr:beta-propeller fold lactonase family protein [Actinoallomurus rhizosphaericola]MCO5999264.1 hypothetical protein [Actinoallomurus rhizosphaericola]
MEAAAFFDLHSRSADSRDVVTIHAGLCSITADMEFSPDGRRLAVWDSFSGSRVEFFDTVNGSRSGISSPITGGVSGALGSSPVAFDRAWRTLAIVSASPTSFTKAAIPSAGNNVQLLDPVTGGEVVRLRDEYPSLGFNAVALSPDGRYVAASEVDDVGGEILMWDVITRKLVARLLPSSTVDSTQFDTVTFSPDGKIVAAVALADNVVHLWDVNTHAKVSTFRIPTDWARAIVFSPDSRILVIETVSDIQVWDVNSRKKLRTLSTDFGMEVQNIALGSDGRILAASTRDSTAGELLLWDIGNGKRITDRHYTTALGGVAFSPDRKTLALCADSGTISLYKVDRLRQAHD